MINLVSRLRLAAGDLYSRVVDLDVFCRVEDPADPWRGQSPL